MEQPEAALELFTGPLLDGFHLPDGAEFEHWLDAERARLDQPEVDVAVRRALQAVDLTGDAVDEHLERLRLVDHGEEPDGQQEVLEEPYYAK